MNSTNPTEEELLAHVKNLEQTVGTLAASLVQITNYLGLLGKHQQEQFSFVNEGLKKIINSQAVYIGEGTVLTFLEEGWKIYVDSKSVDIGSHLMLNGTWERDETLTLKRMIKAGDTVLDIGANHGFYAIQAAAIVGPTGKVYAFEPNPRLSYLLNLSLAVNGFSSWANVSQVAVGASGGEVTLSLRPEYSGSASVTASSQEAIKQAGRDFIEASMISIDEKFPAPSFTVDFIKIDVEGYETFAFRGMKNLIERSPNLTILLEYSPIALKWRGGPGEELLSMLDKWGFKYWEIVSSTELKPISSANLLAMPDNELKNLIVSRQDKK